MAPQEAIMTRTLIVPTLIVPMFAVTALVGTPVSAQDSRPQDAAAAESTLSATPYAPGTTVYRLIDDPGMATTGSASSMEMESPGPVPMGSISADGVTYSFGTTRLCTTSEFERGLC
jgi:hypothetical protein